MFAYAHDLITYCGLRDGSLISGHVRIDQHSTIRRIRLEAGTVTRMDGPEAMTRDQVGPDAWALILALSAWERAQRKPAGNS